MAHQCGKHGHNTVDGAKRCRDNRAVNEVDRKIRTGYIEPKHIVGVDNAPPRIVQIGNVKVYVFRENAISDYAGKR
jgi:hypothetical protein